MLATRPFVDPIFFKSGPRISVDLIKDMRKRYKYSVGAARQHIRAAREHDELREVKNLNLNYNVSILYPRDMPEKIVDFFVEEWKQSDDAKKYVIKDATRPILFYPTMQIRTWFDSLPPRTGTLTIIKILSEYIDNNE